MEVVLFFILEISGNLFGLRIIVVFVVKDEKDLKRLLNNVNMWCDKRTLSLSVQIV